MVKKVRKISLSIALILMVITALFDWKISSGILLGQLFCLLYFSLLNIGYLHIDKGLNSVHILTSVIRMLVLALPLLISALLPQYFNIFGAFVGMMAFRVSLFISGCIRKGGDD